MKDLYRYVCSILCHGNVGVNANVWVRKCVVDIGIDVLVRIL